MLVRTRILNPFWFVVPDLLLMFVSLHLTLSIRYGNNISADFTFLHYKVLSVLFAFWLLVLFIHNLFDARSLRRYHTLFFNLISAMFFSAIIAIVYFYIQPQLLITPRRTLLLLVIITYSLIFLWHLLIKLLLQNKITESLYLFSLNNDELLHLKDEITKHDYLGLKIAEHLSSLEHLSQLPSNSSIIVSERVLSDANLVSRIYELRSRGIAVQSQNTFLEWLLRRIPLKNLRENWFFLHIGVRESRFTLFVRRLADIVVGLVFGLLFFVTFLIIAALVKLDSSGPLFFIQDRVGKSNKIIKIYKYRTMTKESLGRGWTSVNDPRIRPVGKFLRLTHLDELPQFINLLKGDMSVVGPRPEQAEIVAELVKTIPFYNERHFVKPGLTGWGQLNIYAATLEETKLKLEYDLYYLKHRSLLFDLEIILKTIYHIMVK